VDGFSGMIVGFVTMPVKNDVEIYSNLFKRVNQYAGSIIFNVVSTCVDPLSCSMASGTKYVLTKAESGS